MLDRAVAAHSGAAAAPHAAGGSELTRQGSRPFVRTESSQVGWSPSPPEASTVSAKRQVLGTYLCAPAYVGSQDVSDVAGKAPAEEDPCEKNGERGNDIEGAAGEIQD